MLITEPPRTMQQQWTQIPTTWWKNGTIIAAKLNERHQQRLTYFSLTNSLTHSRTFLQNDCMDVRIVRVVRLFQDVRIVVFIYCIEHMILSSSNLKCSNASSPPWWQQWQQWQHRHRHHNIAKRNKLFGSNRKCVQCNLERYLQWQSATIQFFEQIVTHQSQRRRSPQKKNQFKFNGDHSLASEKKWRESRTYLSSL